MDDGYLGLQVCFKAVKQHANSVSYASHSMNSVGSNVEEVNLSDLKFSSLVQQTLDFF